MSLAAASRDPGRRCVYRYQASRKLEAVLRELEQGLGIKVMTTLTHSSVPPLRGKVTDRNPLDGLRMKCRKSGSPLSFMI
jgi:hypothetical protein